MVNYVCRTCLYVCDNEFSFRKLEKVKPVLELFVPEIRNCVGNYSLICEQCYYFLKNVEKFKVKCLETQNKLYSMNLETIRDNHDIILKALANEASKRIQGQKPDILPEKRSATQIISPKDVKKPKCDVARKATADSDISLSSILESSESAQVISAKDLKKSKCDIATVATADSDITLSSMLQSSESTKCTVAHSPMSNDLLQLLGNDKLYLDDLEGFREFAHKPTRTPSQKQAILTNYNEDVPIIIDDDETSNNDEHDETSNKDEDDETSNKEEDDETSNKDEDDETSNKVEDDETSNKDEDDETSNKDEDDETSNKDEDDEYMTRKDLVAAGILSDYSDTENECESDYDMEITELNSKGKNAGNKKANQKKIGKKKETSEKENNIPNKLDVVTVFKRENIGDENPGLPVDINQTANVSLHDIEADFDFPEESKESDTENAMVEQQEIKKKIKVQRKESDTENAMVEQQEIKKKIKVQRKGWSYEETYLVRATFNDFILNKCYPSSREIKEFASKHKIDRTAKVIKAKIQHLMNQK